MKTSINWEELTLKLDILNPIPLESYHLGS